MTAEIYDNVFEALEETAADAAIMKLRADAMIAIQRVVEERGLTQKAAARLFGVTQPRMSDLRRGKIDLFNLEALVAMLATAGAAVDFKLGKVPGPARPSAAPRGKPSQAA